MRSTFNDVVQCVVRRSASRQLLLGLLALFLSGFAVAQERTARIYGRVVDPSGAVIPESMSSLPTRPPGSGRSC